MCKQLSVFAQNKTEAFEANLNNLREVMGVMQHHDAVTGTEKQHVANDYARLLQIGFEKCDENIQESLSQLTENSGFGANVRFERCDNLNISSCHVTENNDKFLVTLYNPLAQSTSQYVRVPVIDGEYEVLDYKNVPVDAQLVLIPNEVKSISFRQSGAKSELVFLAKELPALGFKSYFVQRKSKQIRNPLEKGNGGSFTIGNQYLNLTFDENGLLQSAATENGAMKVRQNFFIYEGFRGNNREFKNRSSGAYIFRPINESYQIASRAEIKVIRGNLVDEVHQVNIYRFKFFLDFFSRFYSFLTDF